MKKEYGKDDFSLTRSKRATRVRWALLFLVGVGLALLFHYRHTLWIRTLGSCEVLRHPKQLKGIILSCGPLVSSGLHFDSNPPGSSRPDSWWAYRVSRGLPLWGEGRLLLLHDWSYPGFVACLWFGAVV